MEQTLINEVVQGMIPYLDNGQLEQLQKVLKHAPFGKTITETKIKTPRDMAEENAKMVDLFISAKRIEGCSEKSLKYYKFTIDTML